MATTIQISPKLKQELELRKFSENETYEEVIWDLVEDSMELSAETKEDIKKSLEDIKAGRVYTLKQIEKEMGL